MAASHAFEDVEDLVLAYDLEGLKSVNEQSSNDPLRSDVLQLSLTILNADFTALLQHPVFTRIVNWSDPQLASKKSTAQRISKYLGESNDKPPAAKCMELLLIGVGCLSIYVQENWTGPSIPPELQATASNLPKQKTLHRLSLDGEEVYRLARFPHFLLTARHILVGHLDALSAHLTSARWWAARCLVANQRTLLGPLNSLKTRIDELYAAVTAQYRSHPRRALGARAEIEHGLIAHYYRDVRAAKLHFKAAQDITGLKYELTGALGRRTKYQTFDTAHLIVKAESAPATTTSEGSVGSSAPTTPAHGSESGASGVDTDDIILPQRAIAEAASEPALAVIDIIVLLCLCVDVKNRNPTHGLTTEQMYPYIERAAQHPRNWLVHSMCLLLKSRIEAQSRKTADRAGLQLQALVDQYNGDKTAGPPERLRYAFTLIGGGYPPRWELQKEVGERLLAIGMAASALAIFEDLELYEEMAQCLRIMDKEAKAVALLRERVDVDPKSPRLWTLLGDLTKDTECYRRAWDASGQKFSRAQRAWGHLCIARSQWHEAIGHLETGLRLNPIFPESWFALGCAYMRVEQWQQAIGAFARTVQLDPDHGDAWANIGTCQVQLRHKREAFQAFQEALKQKYDSWQLWENVLYTAMDVGELQTALHAFGRLVELRPNDLDWEALQLLIKAITSPENVARLATELRKLQELLTSSTAKTTDPRIWVALGDCYRALGNVSQEADVRLKHLRAVQVANWENTPAAFKAVVESSQKLADAVVALNDAKQLYSTRLMLRGLVKKAEPNFAGSEDLKRLETALAKVQEAEVALASKK